MAMTAPTVKKTLAAMACGGLIAAVSACGGSGSDGGETITIGYSGGLSGGAAEYGKLVESGLELAIDDLNDDGVEIDGDDYTFELESLDDQYDPSESGKNAQRLVEQDDASVVFVPHAGGIKAAQEINSGRSEFLLGAYSSDPEIVKQDNPLTMMIPPSFVSFVAPSVEKLQDNGAEKLGLLTTSSEFGQQWTERATKEWEKQGGTVLGNNNIDYGEVSDFSGPVSKTLSDDPDTIMVGGPSQPTALIMEEARKQGFDGSFLIIDQAKLEEMEQFTDPENLNDSIGVMPIKEYDDPGTEQLLDSYHDKYSEDKAVTAEVSLNYQAMAIIAKAMEEAGTADDPKEIREAIPDALDNVDDKYHVSGFPSQITDGGHLLADELKIAYRNTDGEYDYFEVDQPED